MEEDQVAERACYASALEYLKDQVEETQLQLRKMIEEKDELQEADIMEIEWTNPAIPPNFLAEIQKAMNEGKLQIAKPTLPPSRSSSRASG